LKRVQLPTRREFLKSAGALAAARIAGSAAPARRPNLVLVLAGGWRGGQLLDDLRVPNFQALAKQGVNFERLYTCYPSATPARAALITGRFPHACGVPRDAVRLPLDQPSIAEQMKGAGYRTGYIGGWRLDGSDDPGFVPPGPQRHGFDYWAAFNRGRRYFDSIYFRDTSEPIHHTGFEPDYQTDLAIDFINQSDSKPFYLFLAWGPPHPPYLPSPDRVATRYDPQKVRLRANVPSEQQASSQANCAHYYALCSALDDNLGRLVAALDDRHLADDTIIVFTSDSGDMLGSQGLEGDNEPFEEAVRVPLIIRYPGTLSAGQNDALLSNVDLMPTLLKLCGVDIPENVQGQDFSVHRESIYCSGKLGDPDEWRMVVRGLDKLVVDRGLNVTHLYNLGQDPFEMENLVREVSQDLKRDELKALLKDSMRRSGDGMDPSGLKKRV
jgi:arylsulfatase A-like enzyme